MPEISDDESPVEVTGAADQSIPPPPVPPPPVPPPAPPPAPAPNRAATTLPNRERLLAALQRFEPLIAAIGERKPELNDGLLQELASLRSVVQTSEDDSLLGEVTEFGKRLKVLLAEPQSNAKQDSNSGTLVRLQQARLLWIAMRKHLQSELTKLVNAIVTKSTAEPDFQEIERNHKISLACSTRWIPV